MTEKLKRYLVAEGCFAYLCEHCTLKTIRVSNEDIDLDHVYVDDETGNFILSHDEYIALGGVCVDGELTNG